MMHPLLETRIQEREALLTAMRTLLESDPRIGAAWLAGSFGRGEADALSDLDLWVAVADADCAEVVAGRQAFVRQIQEPVLILEAPQNGPPQGGYLLVFYPGQEGGHQVDWYWQPQSQAQLPQTALLLFDRVGLPREIPTPLATGAETPRLEEAEKAVLFFWAMLPIIAKKIARRHHWEALEMLRMVQGTLREAKTALRLTSPSPAWEARTAIPSATPSEQWAHLRQLGQEMEEVMGVLQTQGGTIPTEAIQLAYRFFDLAESDLCLG